MTLHFHDCATYLEEAELWVKAHHRVVVQVLGQWKLVDFDGTLKFKQGPKCYTILLTIELVSAYGWDGPRV
jgi:hypothetical protein